MQRPYFFNGQRIGSDDLNTIPELLGAEIKHRTIDFFSKGVIGASSDIFVLNDLNNTIKLEPFIAYNLAGERINMYQEIRALALDLSTPTERRLRQQGALLPENFGWERNTNYDIYISYIEKPGRPQAQITTGKFYPTRIYTGFEFYAIRPGVDTVPPISIDITGMVRLCRLNYDGTNVTIFSNGFLEFSTINAAKVFTQVNAEVPVTYNPLAPVSMESHIMCLGSGVPSPKNPHGYTPEDLGINATSVQTHETRMHVTGIKGSRESVTSALYIGLNSITTVQDNLILYNLLGEERLHSDGSWLTTLPGTNITALFIQFMDGTAPNFTPLPAGTYRIGINPTDGSLAISTTATATGRMAILSFDSAGLNEYGRVIIMDTAAYAKLKVFDLAEFSFDPAVSVEKPISYIVNTIPRSNFVTKTDLRLFGSTSASELSTKKINNEDILSFPYTIKANKLVLSSGVELTGSAVLPPSYITGLTLVYSTGNTITVTAGRARDASNRRDIILETNLTKQLDTPWTPGGVDTSVGGLMNDPITPYLPPAGGVGLHVFAIMTDGGVTDVAIDTDPNAIHILNANSPTASYQYVKRIGSLYMSHEYGLVAGNPVIFPFTTIVDGTGTWIYYRTAMELTTSIYDVASKSFTHSYVPDGVTFFSRFTYRTPKANVFNKVMTNIQPFGVWVNGGGIVDLPVSNQQLLTTDGWDFANFIYTVGYYDGRN